MASKADYKRIYERITLAKNYHDRVWQTRDKAFFDLYRQGYTTVTSPETNTTGLLDRAVLNYIGRDVDLKVAALAHEPPVFRHRPRKIESEQLAAVWDAVLPYVWREGEIHKQMKAALRDRYIYGRSVVAIDWKVETQQRYFEGDRPEEMPADVVLYDNPFVRRISPRRFFLDPGVDALNWEEASYVVWEMLWPLDRLKRWAKSDPRVKDGLALKLQGDAQIGEAKTGTFLDYRETSAAGDAKRATIWRYHERESNKVYYIAKEHPTEPLLSIENPYEMEGYPFEMHWGRPVPDVLDGIGHAEVMRYWQELFNLIRFKQAGMIRTARHMVWIQGLSEEDRQALETDLDRIIVRGDPGSIAPREINTTGFPPEFIQGEQALRIDQTELSQIPAGRRGLKEPGVETATEAANITQLASVGERNEQAEWEDMNRRVARKVKMLLEQFGDAQRLAAVSPDIAEGLEQTDEMAAVGVQVTPSKRFTWIQYTPQQIADESDVEVLAGSMGVKEELVERRQFAAGIKAAVEVSTAGPQMQAIGLNPQQIARELFRRFGNVDTERFFQEPVPLPVAQPGQPGGNGQPADPMATMQGMIQEAMKTGSTGG